MAIIEVLFRRTQCFFSVRFDSYRGKCISLGTNLCSHEIPTRVKFMGAVPRGTHFQPSPRSPAAISLGWNKRAMRLSPLVLYQDPCVFSNSQELKGNTGKTTEMFYTTMTIAITLSAVWQNRHNRQRCPGCSDLLIAEYIELIQKSGTSDVLHFQSRVAVKES
jgi:hypothetical protein